MSHVPLYAESRSKIYRDIHAYTHNYDYNRGNILGGGRGGKERKKANDEIGKNGKYFIYMNEGDARQPTVSC
jgi:hypothetical protein